MRYSWYPGKGRNQKGPDSEGRVEQTLKYWEKKKYQVLMTLIVKNKVAKTNDCRREKREGGCADWGV